MHEFCMAFQFSLLKKYVYSFILHYSYKWCCVELDKLFLFSSRGGEANIRVLGQNLQVLDKYLCIGQNPLVWDQNLWVPEILSKTQRFVPNPKICSKNPRYVPKAFRTSED